MKDVLTVLFTGWLVSTGFVLYWWYQDLTSKTWINISILLFKEDSAIHSLGFWVFHLFAVFYPVLLIVYLIVS
jgi:hypothetical protein